MHFKKGGSINKRVPFEVECAHGSRKAYRGVEWTTFLQLVVAPGDVGTEFRTLCVGRAGSMSRLTRLSQFGKQGLWTRDLTTMPSFQRLGTQAFRLATAVGMEFRHRLLDARAAGLVFTTLLSLVPFLAVMFSVLKAFDVHHLVEPLLAQALEPLGPKGQEITTTIVGFVDNIKVGVLGVVGIAGLFYTTYSLIDKIEQALNAIWQVKQGRSWGRKFSDYLSAVLVGPVLVFSAFGLLASLQNHSLVQRLVELEPLGTLVVWSGELIPFLMLCGVFTFFYKMIPNTHVQMRSALVGGVSAAILWLIAEEVFAKFVVTSAKYSAIYSSFAVLILFLLWLYVGWMIVLIGAQFSFFTNTRPPIYPACCGNRAPSCFVNSWPLKYYGLWDITT